MTVTWIAITLLLAASFLKVGSGQISHWVLALDKYQTG